MINYKFNEGELIKELQAYIDSTYGGHYSSQNIQAADLIFAIGIGKEFCQGNAMKYLSRLGKKGTPDDARKDMMKVMHYAMMWMYLHDEDQKPEEFEYDPK